MSLSKEQVKHDRVNLGRLVKHLENVLTDENWMHGASHLGEEAWVKVQGIAQKIRYARKLLLSVDYYQELDSQASSPSPSREQFLQNMRQTLGRLDNIIDTASQRLNPGPGPDVPTSYLQLVPIPTVAETVHTVDTHALNPSPAAGLLPSDGVPPERHLSPVPIVPGPEQDPIPSSSTSPPTFTAHGSSSQPIPTSSLLSASLQTHEELSNELARMATQLKRNAMHFSDSLDKDKSLIQSASEALEKNYDSMANSHVRLRSYAGKNSGTTWMVIGGLIAVSVAWVFTFFVIRLT